MLSHGQLQQWLREQTPPLPRCQSVTEVWADSYSCRVIHILGCSHRLNQLFLRVLVLFLTVSFFCQLLFFVCLFIGQFPPPPLLRSTHLSQCWPLCFPFLSFLSLPVCGVELADALPFLAERGGCASALDVTSSCSASCTEHRWGVGSNFGKADCILDSCSQIDLFSQ